MPADADICVCTDLDEVFLPGWRTALEAAWKLGTNCAQYRYVWSFHDDGSEGTVFYICKVHARTGFAWKHPVHEVLVKTDGLPEVSVTVPGMQLNHYPDPAKSRASYLPLLEYSVQEDPADDRNMHYLGREYFYYGRWEACMETLKRHLQLPSATWRDERAASMRYIARASAQLGREAEAHSWFLRAVAEAPHLREPYLDYARWLYEKENWDGVLFFAKGALQITNRPATYICEADAWGSLPWDLCALGLYYTGRAADLPEMAEYPEIVSQRIRKESVERYSGNQDSRMTLRGIAGTAVFGRMPEECLDWLIAGELVHMGKNTSFGFGKYILERKGVKGI